MDSEDYIQTNNVSNGKLVFGGAFKTYVPCIVIGTDIFCEFKGPVYNEPPRYYNLAHFSGTNVIHRFAVKSFDSSSDGLWHVRKPYIGVCEALSALTPTMFVTGSGIFPNPVPRYLFNELIMREVCSFMTDEVSPVNTDDINSTSEPTTRSRIIVNISKMIDTGKYIYTIDNVAYPEEFPLEWALTPKTSVRECVDGVVRLCIRGPGTSPNHCGNCNSYGSHRGVFLGYCGNCAREYNNKRGRGRFGMEAEMEWLQQGGHIDSYLYGVDLNTVGYDNEAVCCLTGGPLPEGPDICDNQEDMDPINENEIDEYIGGFPFGSQRHSKRYPRRAYGLPMHSYRQVVNVKHTDTMTPDFIRQKLETFYAANNIEVTNNNYSFPIGPRSAADPYRMQKRPYWWFAWTALLLSPTMEDVKLEIRLYLSNVHTETHPATLHLECNNVCGRNNVYWPMMTHMEKWILDKADSPVFAVPTHPDIMVINGPELLANLHNLMDW